MANWVRADVDFSLPRARYTVPVDSAAGRELLALLAQRKSVDELAEAAAALVLRARPYLQSMLLAGVHYAPIDGCWVLEVLHPALPRVPIGSVVVLEPLGGHGK